MIYTTTEANDWPPSDLRPIIKLFNCLTPDEARHQLSLYLDPGYGQCSEHTKNDEKLLVFLRMLAIAVLRTQIDGESLYPPPNETEYRAIHEAGHAVAALCVGWQAQWVSIIPASESAIADDLQASGRDMEIDAFCLYSRSLGRRQDAWEQAIGAMAGCAAEAVAFGCPTFQQDIDHALSTAKRVTSSRSRRVRYVNRAYDRAHEILQSNWIYVERLAARLQQEGELSGYDATLAMFATS